MHNILMSDFAFVKPIMVLYGNLGGEDVGMHVHLHGLISDILCICKICLLCFTLFLNA